MSFTLRSKDQWSSGRSRYLPKSERGATAVEYGLMVGLVAIGIVGAATTLQGKVSDSFQNAAGRANFHIAGAPGSAIYGRAELNIRQDGSITGYAFWPGGSRVKAGLVPEIPGDPVTGTLTATTMSVNRDCSRYTGTAGCTETWTMTKQANGTYVGVYNPGNGPITLIP